MSQTSSFTLTNNSSLEFSIDISGVYGQMNGMTFRIGPTTVLARSTATVSGVIHSNVADLTANIRPSDPSSSSNIFDICLTAGTGISDIWFLNKVDFLPFIVTSVVANQLADGSYQFEATVEDCSSNCCFTGSCSNGLLCSTGLLGVQVSVGDNPEVSYDYYCQYPCYVNGSIANYCQEPDICCSQGQSYGCLEFGTCKID